MNYSMNCTNVTYIFHIHPERRCVCGEAFRYDRECLQCGRAHPALPPTLDKALQLVFERHIGEVYDVLIQGRRKYPNDDALERGASEHLEHLLEHIRRAGKAETCDLELTELKSAAARALLLLATRTKELGC